MAVCAGPCGGKVQQKGNEVGKLVRGCGTDQAGSGIESVANVRACQCDATCSRWQRKRMEHTGNKYGIC